MRKPINFTILLLAVAACPISAAEIDAQTRAQRQKLVEGLSEVEAARLARNFKKFQQLSESEREELRNLQKGLEQDAKESTGLRELMHTYYDWLATLTPGQRDDLRRATPARRVELVRKLHEEQERQPKPLRSPENSGAFGNWGMRFPHPPAGGLSERDLKAVMQVLETAVRPGLSPEQQSRLDKLRGPARHMFLIEEALHPEQKGPLFGEDATRLVNEMAGQISEPVQRQRVMNGTLEHKRGTLVFLIGLGILSEIERLKPDEATRAEFFATLKPSQQRELTGLSADELKLRLTYMYVEAHRELFPSLQPPPELLRWMKRIRDLRQQMNPFDGPRPPPRFPPGPPREGRPDEFRRKMQESGKAPRDGDPQHGPDENNPEPGPKAGRPRPAGEPGRDE